MRSRLGPRGAALCTGVLCILVLAALSAASAVQAQTIYRTVTPDGRVTFSDRTPTPARTPPGAADSANTNPSSAPAAPAAAASTSAGTGAATPPLTGLPYALRQVAGRYPVTLYTGNDCAPCDAARSALRQRGVPYTERTVQTAADLQALQRISSQQQLPFASVGHQHLVGWDASEWQQYLDLAGYPAQSTLPGHWQQTAATPLTPLALPPAAPSAVPPAARAPAVAPPPAPASLPASSDSSRNPAGITF